MASAGGLHTKTTLVVLIALAIILTALPATTAFPDPTTPFIAAHTLAGPGWGRFDVTSDGSKLEAYVTANLTGPNAAGAVLVSSSTGGAFMLTLLQTDAGPELHVQSSTLGQDVSVEPVPAGASGMMGAGVILSGGGPAKYAIVAWGAGDVSDMRATVFGASGNTLTSTASGSRAFLHPASDFKGVNVGATASVLKPGVISGSVAQTVGGTVVGQFMSIGEGNLAGVTTQQQSVTTPTGTHACPCFWMDPNAAATPGDYTFSLAYVGATFVSNVFLTGADLSG